MTEPHVYLNKLTQEAAERDLLRCCGSTRWVRQMSQQRPFPSAQRLYGAAEQVWWVLTEHDHLEAFGHHPRIGADRSELARRYPQTAALSEREQAGVAGSAAAVLDRLQAANEAYAERFGFVFLVCATG